MVTVTQIVEQYVSAADPTQTLNIEVSVEITIIVESGCDITDLSTSTVFSDPIIYNIGETGFDLSFLFE